MFVLYVSLEVTFLKPPYNFNTTTLGLLYLAPTIGFAVSSVLGGRVADHELHADGRGRVCLGRIHHA